MFKLSSIRRLRHKNLHSLGEEATQQDRVTELTWVLKESGRTATLTSLVAGLD